MTRRLLVADDSATIQKVVMLSLAGEDISVEAVSSGDEAIEKAKLLKPDLILADVFMPGPSGYEVCEAVKGNPELAHTPVILLVGAFEPFDEVEAARVKSDAFLTKPFDTSELLQAVRSFLPEQKPPEVAEAPPPAEQSKEAEMPVNTLLWEPLVPSGTLVSTRTRESFLGAGRILDLYGVGLAPPAVLEPSQAPESGSRARETVPATAVEEKAAAVPTISDEMINHIVERVVERISPDVVREVAWEVIPELSEILIRQYVKEHGESLRLRQSPGPE